MHENERMTKRLTNDVMLPLTATRQNGRVRAFGVQHNPAIRHSNQYTRSHAHRIKLQILDDFMSATQTHIHTHTHTHTETERQTERQTHLVRTNKAKRGNVDAHDGRVSYCLRLLHIFTSGIVNKYLFRLPATATSMNVVVRVRKIISTYANEVGKHKHTEN